VLRAEMSDLSLERVGDELEVFAHDVLPALRSA